MWAPSLFFSYSQLIAEWPVAVLLSCLAFIFLCTLAGLLGSPPLDFSEPLLVREATGRERDPLNGISSQLSLGQTVDPSGG